MTIPNRRNSGITEKMDGITWLPARDHEVREHILVTYDNLFQSILSYASRRQSYF